VTRQRIEAIEHGQFVLSLALAFRRASRRGTHAGNLSERPGQPSGRPAMVSAARRAYQGSA
jgi:hypothetical protein